MYKNHFSEFIRYFTTSSKQEPTEGGVGPKDGVVGELGEADSTESKAASTSEYTGEESKSSRLLVGYFGEAASFGLSEAGRRAVGGDSDLYENGSAVDDREEAAASGPLCGPLLRSGLQSSRPTGGSDSRGSAGGDREAASTFGSDLGDAAFDSVEGDLISDLDQLSYTQKIPICGYIGIFITIFTCMFYEFYLLFSLNL